MECACCSLAHVRNSQACYTTLHESIEVEQTCATASLLGLFFLVLRASSPWTCACGCWQAYPCLVLAPFVLCVLWRYNSVASPPRSPSSFTPHGAPRPLSFASNFAGLLRTGRSWTPAGIAKEKQGRAHKSSCRTVQAISVRNAMHASARRTSLRQPATASLCLLLFRSYA